MDPELAAAFAAMGGGPEMMGPAFGRMLTDPAGQNLLAEQAAAAGMPPPSLTGGATEGDLGGLLNPMPGGPGAGMMGAPAAPPMPMPRPQPAMMAPPAQPAPPVGAPMDIRSPQQVAGEAVGGARAEGTGGGMNQLLQTLQNIKAPAAPTPARVGTPAAPRPHGQIKGGELMALLQAMEAGPGRVQMPVTLGQALGGR